MTTLQLLTAKVGHKRHHPKVNSFLYNVFYIALPVHKVPPLPTLFSIDRWNILSVATNKHGAKDGSPLYPWILSQFSNADIQVTPQDSIVLIAHPRLLGYAFNPITFWLLIRGEKLISVLCEVQNTFGSNHNYLLSHHDHRGILPTDVFHSKKKLYVSPFNTVANGEYSFMFNYSAIEFKATIEYYQDGVHTLSTFMGGAFSPLTSTSILLTIMKYPLMTFLVVARIYYQAVRLWLKGVVLTLNTKGEKISGDTTIGRDSY